MSAVTIKPPDPQKGSTAALIGEAADRLLKAVKEKMLREHGKIDTAKLRRDGYSEQTIARLEEV